jgi:hypothetical protein
VCRLNYPTCNEYAPYCRLWPAPVYNIFPHYLINGTIFKKKLLNTKWILIFSMASNISHSKMKWARYNKKCIVFIMLSTCYSCPILMKTWIFSGVFPKIVKYKISQKSVQWEPSCSMRMDGWTDKHDKANGHLSQFCEHT